MNRANEARDMTKKLGQLADRTGCAIVLIGHMNKAGGSKAAYRGIGSIDFFAVARSVLLVARVAEQEDKIGALISGTSFKTFEAFWELMGKQKHEEDATEKINQQNLLYKYYKRYIEIEYHPTIKRRKEVVAKTRKWGLADYLEQIIVIWKSKLRKKGWNGRRRY